MIIFEHSICFRIFLLKQIVRNHGLDALKKITEIRNLSWILPENMRQAEVKLFTKRTQTKEPFYQLN